MNWNRRVRRTHRALAMIFTVSLVVTIVVLVLGGPEWVSFLPFPPLALLFLSGAHLYARPFVAARRGGKPADIASQPSSARIRPVATRIRQLHRWAAVAFTVTVLATFVALSLPEPVIWVSYLPLIPLAVLFFSGMYQFVLPYRTARSAGSSARRPAAA